MRDAPYQVYWDAVNTLPIFFTYSSFALPFLPRPDPQDDFYPVFPEYALEAGNYSRVPVIAGDQQDEGTLFAQVQYNITDNGTLAEYMHMIYPGASQPDIEALLAVYPEDPAAGSPFGTGTTNTLWSQSKKMASLLGDVAFTLRRRSYLSHVSTTLPAWSLLDSHRFQESVLGTYHSSDIEAIFNTTSILPTTRNTVATQTYLTHYIFFVNYQNPNAISIDAPLLYWPQYSTWNPVLLNLLNTGNALIQDDFRQEASNFLESTVSQFRL